MFVCVLFSFMTEKPSKSYIQSNFQSFQTTDLDQLEGMISQDDCASKCDQDSFCVSFDYCLQQKLDQEGRMMMVEQHKCRLSSSSPLSSSLEQQPPNVKLHEPFCSIFTHRRRRPISALPILNEPDEVLITHADQNKDEHKKIKMMIYSMFSLSFGIVIGQLIVYKFKLIVINLAK